MILDTEFDEREGSSSKLNCYRADDSAEIGRTLGAEVLERVVENAC